MRCKMQKFNMSRVRQNQQQGMTLLEVVVSMLLIGLGMVASISMIQEGMRSNVAALNRNSALYLSDAIIDRMRVNSFAVPQYLSGAANTLISVVDSSGKVKEPSVKACSDCTAQQQKNAYAQARTDVKEWRTELSEKLPGATYAIYAEDADSGQYAVALSWPNYIGRRDIAADSGGDTEDGEGVAGAGKSSSQNDDLVIIFTL